MKTLLSAGILTATFLTCALDPTAAAQSPTPTEQNADMPKSSKPFRLVLHGGAGTIDRTTMTPEREKEYRAALEQALRAGYDILKRGGAGLDAVEAAVRVLEDDPHFNAGRGAVFTAAGTHELDAAIMEGRTRKVGAIAGVRHIRNPITVARMVMEKSAHVLLTGEGAEDLAKQL
ncbi:MAG TPA: isoaspartyl peptidase/L-asparaginase, partial [Chthoniobacterales bacterium]|nr:isoaspartyl peptidase/L-asparaginase [Chthoniobacterales bacterium]